MIYEGYIFTKEGDFKKGIVKTENDIIVDITYDDNISSDKYIIPALIDIHLHGAAGYDFSDGSIEAINKIADYEKEHGIAAFCGATMTIPDEELEKALASFKESKLESLKGIYLEGPFISKAYCGAQKKECVKEASLSYFNKILEQSDNRIKFLVLAPEEVREAGFIKEITDKGIMVSLGHTAADYELAMKAFNEGASQVTHLYNGMKDMTKREPGLPGAAFDSDAYIELIVDRNHLSDTTVRMAFKAFNKERIILISDSMRATGLKDGSYTLGGQEVMVKTDANRGIKSARLEDNTLAGSVSNLHECLINAINAGVPMADAINAASLNPARRLKIDDKYGSIEIGKYAPIYLF